MQWQRCDAARRELRRHRGRDRLDLRADRRRRRLARIRSDGHRHQRRGLRHRGLRAHDHGRSAAPPVDTTAPAVDGDARDGETLTADDGTWTGTPTDSPTSYQWQRCDDDGTATASTSRGETGEHLRAHRRRRRPRRPRRASPRPTTPAATPRTPRRPPWWSPTRPPTTSSRPLSGTPRDGETLTARRGTWDGTAPIAYNYVWERCTPPGVGCADDPGARPARPTR